MQFILYIYISIIFYRSPRSHQERVLRADSGQAGMKPTTASLLSRIPQNC